MTNSFIFPQPVLPGFEADTHQEGHTRLQVQARKWLAHRVAAGEIEAITARTYRIALDHFSEVCGDTRIDARSIARWQRSVGHLAPSTRRNHHSVVNAFCAYLVEIGELSKNPMERVKAPQEPRRLPRAITQPDPIPDACVDARELAVVTLMLQQGCRRVEVARLQVGDIDLAGRTMRVIGKGRHERVLPVLEQTRYAVSRYLVEMRGSHAGPLVVSKTDPYHGLCAETIGRLVSAVMLRAGVKARYGDGIAGHALRHTAITDMVRAGASLRDVQQAAGHAHLHATEVYLPLAVAGLEIAMGGRWYGTARPAS